MIKMIIKNKFKLKSGSKILVLGLMLIMLVGIFIPIVKIRADDTLPPTLGTCRQGTAGEPTKGITKKDCESKNDNIGSDEKKWIWTSYYYNLAPLPDPDNNGQPQDPFDPTKPNQLSDYLNLMIKLFIGICAVLAVIMIFMGGIEYMTSELPGLKSDGKGKMINAILGLLLALGAWTLLNTINPNLLKSDLSSLGDVTVNATAQNFAASPSTYIVPLGQTGKASGTNCDENAVAAANAGLSNAQIHTLACIGGIESGCQSIQNYNWGNGSSAYGPFQILLQGNAGCFESDACRQAAGANGPLNCAAGFYNGNPIPGSPIVEQCKKAANNFNCSVSAAACLIKKNPSYSDWKANPNLSKCI